jgi:hypothetical protein
MKLAELRDFDEGIETVWLHDLTPEEIETLEVECQEDRYLLYPDFIYGKCLEKQKNLGEAGTLFKGSQKAFVVRKGKKTKVKVRRRAKPLSSKQKQALKKAQRRSQTGSAKAKRKKSYKIRKGLNLRPVKGGIRGGALRRNR